MMLLYPTLILLLTTAPTISQKQAALAQKSSQPVEQINTQLTTLRHQLQRAYAQAQQLHAQQAPASSYKKALSELQQLQEQLQHCQQAWQTKNATQLGTEASAAIWDPGPITLAELIAEYGGGECLYLFSPQIAALKIHLHSSLPIPRALWSELLELILTHNGIGIQNIHPYARQLYQLHKQAPPVTHIATQKQQLLPLPPPHPPLLPPPATTPTSSHHRAVLGTVCRSPTNPPLPRR